MRALPLYSLIDTDPEETGSRASKTRTNTYPNDTEGNMLRAEVCARGLRASRNLTEIGVESREYNTSSPL